MTDTTPWLIEVYGIAPGLGYSIDQAVKKSDVHTGIGEYDLAKKLWTSIGGGMNVRVTLGTRFWAFGRCSKVTNMMREKGVGTVYWTQQG